MKSKPKIRFVADGRMEVWAATRPGIGLQAVQRLLMRHVAVVCPESDLWVAIIAQAMGDAIGRNDLQRHRARRFLNGGPDLAYWCDLIGIDPGFVREVATRAGYLVDEDALWKPAQAVRTRRARHRVPDTREAACA